MIGGMISSTLLTLIVIPAIFGLVEGFRLSSTHPGDRQPPTRNVERAKPAHIPEPAE
jgi:hypothetical protein